jgi:hypothetical protein
MLHNAPFWRAKMLNGNTTRDFFLPKFQRSSFNANLLSLEKEKSEEISRVENLISLCETDEVSLVFLSSVCWILN